MPGGATPSPDEIGEDLDILSQETNLIRTYGSCDELAVILPLARKRIIYLYQGIHLSSSNAENQRQITCYAQFVAENGNISGAIAGNEVLLRGDLTEAELVALIEQIKQLGDLPVSTGETWGAWCDLRDNHPRCPGLSTLHGAVNFVFAHIHPYLEAVPIEHAAAHVIAAQIYLRTTYTDKRVVVGEAGWPTCGTPNDGAVPSPANHRQFIEELWRWASLYQVRIVYFEAFDEPWKNEPHGVGPCWGMFNADRTPKHSNRDWSLPPPAPTPTMPTVLIDHPLSNINIPVKGNCGIPVIGRAYQAGAGWQVQVEVFTDKWYVQNKWYPNGRAPVIDGQWAMPEVVLAGQGQFNNHRIWATLLDEASNAVTSTEVSGIVRNNNCQP